MIWAIVGVCGLYLVLWLVARRYESKCWNGGICPDCGGKFEYFDTDSQGGRGYKCDSCRKTTWQTYGCDFNSPWAE